jgi:hypothetical protein
MGSIWSQLCHHTLSKLRGLRFTHISYPWLELNFAGGLDENLYKHLHDFEETCATLMILGMNHETLKWKAFPFLLMGWAKQWYKLHVSSCHGSWVILKYQFCFTFFLLPKTIDLRNEVLNFAQKEVESLGAA